MVRGFSCPLADSRGENSPVVRRSHRGSLGLLCVRILEERTNLPKANCLEASKEFSICNRTKTEFSFPIYVPSKREREREESSRWRKAGHRIAHILSALCMQLNCFRVHCSCNIPEMNQRSSRFRPCPPDFELSHTRICTCVCMSVYIIVFTTANVNVRRVYRGPCGASLFSV